MRGERMGAMPFEAPKSDEDEVLKPEQRGSDSGIFAKAGDAEKATDEVAETDEERRFFKKGDEMSADFAEQQRKIDAGEPLDAPPELSSEDEAEFFARGELIDAYNEAERSKIEDENKE